MCLRCLFLVLVPPLLSMAQQAIYPSPGTLFDEQVHWVDIQMAPDSLSLLWSSSERQFYCQGRKFTSGQCGQECTNVPVLNGLRGMQACVFIPSQLNFYLEDVAER